jgi:hypothetical protein
MLKTITRTENGKTWLPTHPLYVHDSEYQEWNTLHSRLRSFMLNLKTQFHREYLSADSTTNYANEWNEYLNKNGIYSENGYFVFPTSLETFFSFQNENNLSK